MVAAASINDDTGLKLCRLLLEHGASVNTTDNDGFNCLHWAAGVGNPKICKYLTEEAAVAINCRSKKEGETPLHRAARLSQVDTVRYATNAITVPCVDGMLIALHGLCTLLPL